MIDELGDVVAVELLGTVNLRRRVVEVGLMTGGSWLVNPTYDVR